MNKSEAAKLRTEKLLAKDPEYFAKLAARGKGMKQPNRARTVDKQAAAKGGLNRNNSMKNKLRKQRSAELQEKLKREQEEASHKASVLVKKRAEAKEQRQLKQMTHKMIGKWDENEATVEDWE